MARCLACFKIGIHTIFQYLSGPVFEIDPNIQVKLLFDFSHKVTSM
jgi:hypothetical protein